MSGSEWQAIETTPYDQEVFVRIEGRTKAFRAILRAMASLSEDEVPCDQWQAVGQDYPKCWSDGACWSSNADGLPSAQPEAWKPIP